LRGEKNMLTTVVAVYAAIVATLNMFVAVRLMMRDRACMSVSLLFGLEKDVQSGRFVPRVALRLVNTGRRQMTISECGIRLLKGSFKLPNVDYAPEMFFRAKDFPFTLQESGQRDFPAEPSQFPSEGRAIGWAKTSSGEMHKSRRYRLEELLNSSRKDQPQIVKS
jgi:hypothetical protein